MPDSRTPATVLLAQAFLLGITLAFLVIPGNAVFLETQGADRLPYAYIGIALAGTAVSAGLNRLQARVGLFRLGTSTSVLVAGLVAAAWLMLVVVGRTEASLGVLVLAAVHGQLGFAFIGAQAGRAFDVQAIKRAFPRIVSGFVFGFMVGGAAADPLVRLVRDPSHLLLLAAFAAVVFAALIARAGRLVLGDAAAPATGAGPSGPATPFSQLLRTPLVGAVFTYQVLSTMGTQLLEYLLYERAAARFVGAADLAGFLGRYTFGLNLVDLVVLAVVGGWIMARYGLRLGVSANPAVVTVLVLGALVAATTQGIDSTSLFVLVAVARILDLTIADGATRTSINATFQALPAAQRLPAQLGVEGAGVPVALGLTAALVLIVNSRPGTNTVGVLVATGVVCLLWCLAAVVVFVRYRAAVVAAARRGLLAGPDLEPSEPATLSVLLRLASSAEPEDVTRALAILDPVHDPRLTAVLHSNVRSDDAQIRTASLQMLAVRDQDAGLAAARAGLAGDDEAERLASVRALAAADRPEAVMALSVVAAAESGPPRASALAGLVRHEDSRATAAETMSTLATSPSTDDRVCAATAVGESDEAATVGLLVPLLADDAPRVRTAAEAAVCGLGVDLQVELFGRLRTSVNAEALDRFLRTCDVGRDSPLAGVVARWLAADPSRHDPALRRLGRSGWMADDQSLPAMWTLAEAAVDHIGTAHGWLATVPQGDGRDDVARLRRALATEMGEGRSRLLDALGPIVGPSLVRGVGVVLDGSGDGDEGLALESLELMLDREHRHDVLHALRWSSETDAGESMSTSLDAVATLTADVGWATYPDWLQACALAVLHVEGVAASVRITPVGPVSAQLCD